MERVKTIAVNIVVTLILSLVIIWGNTYYRQLKQFNRGEAALARGDYMGAIAGYEAAIHMYTPGSSRVYKAATRLWDVGEALEKANDKEMSIIAYRALRSSFYAAAWLYTPGSDWIGRCDAKIAQLVKR
jgi:hypothetical protein